MVFLQGRRKVAEKCLSPEKLSDYNLRDNGRNCRGIAVGEIGNRRLWCSHEVAM